MRLIKIEKLSNGAHSNQTTSDLNKVPEGWAVVPDNMEIPNTFPFVNITVENGIVTSMTAGVVPEPEPIPEPKPIPETEPTDTDVLNALLGVSE